MRWETLSERRENMDTEVGYCTFVSVAHDTVTGDWRRVCGRTKDVWYADDLDPRNNLVVGYLDHGTWNRLAHPLGIWRMKSPPRWKTGQGQPTLEARQWFQRVLDSSELTGGWVRGRRRGCSVGDRARGSGNSPAAAMDFAWKQWAGKSMRLSPHWKLVDVKFVRIMTGELWTSDCDCSVAIYNGATTGCANGGAVVEEGACSHVRSA
jgi:hypothetical protein